jgi:hypothetical protein
MRKVALALAAAALLLCAGSLVWKADATGVGTLDFARVAKNYSPVNVSPAVSTPFASPATRWCAGCSTAGAPAAATSTAEARPPNAPALIGPKAVRPDGLFSWFRHE